MTNNLDKLIASGKLRCPACSGVIKSGERLSCSACDRVYPVVNAIPLLVPKPEEIIGLWQNRLSNLSTSQQRNVQSNQQLIASATTYPPLRERLKKVTQARIDNLQTIVDLLAPLQDLGPGIAPASHTDSPGFFTTLVYLFRDWAWDTDEVDILCNKVIELLPNDLAPESLLVLGAGGCRASFDLHNHYNCPLTVSVDISPLMLLGAARVVTGGELNLYQILPNNIRDAHGNLSYWKLHAPRRPDNDFLFTFADATRLPFPENAFQVVLTPFIIDEIREDLRDFAPKVRRLLEPGGFWVNYGAMTFLPGINYTAEEIIAIVRESGFRVLDHGFSKQTHGAPRESCHHQVYDCLYFIAVRE